MIRVTKDGRTIRTGKDYMAFRRELFYAQVGRCMVTECGRCTFPLVDPEFDFSFHVSHRGSRGMGGAIRDDVVGPKRGQVEGGKCGKCHRKDHGQ